MKYAWIVIIKVVSHKFIDLVVINVNMAG